MTNTEHNNAEAKRCFDSRMQSIRVALADSAKLDELLEDCLAVDAHIVVDIQLSTGGPGDGFKIACNAVTGQPLHGCHYFAWWGFRREVPLSEDELAEVCAAYALDDGRVYIHPAR